MSEIGFWQEYDPEFTAMWQVKKNQVASVDTKNTSKWHFNLIAVREAQSFQKAVAKTACFGPQGGQVGPW